ncbi:hypothetical protein JL720_2691 [Aureococcus anophagefferens]|nr:hypothetical protein JL720_2691 [Aureococcus anophagefferens]
MATLVKKRRSELAAAEESEAEQEAFRKRSRRRASAAPQAARGAGGGDGGDLPAPPPAQGSAAKAANALRPRKVLEKQNVVTTEEFESREAENEELRRKRALAAEKIKERSRDHLEKLAEENRRKKEAEDLEAKRLARRQKLVRERVLKGEVDGDGGRPLAKTISNGENKENDVARGPKAAQTDAPAAEKKEPTPEEKAALAERKKAQRASVDRLLATTKPKEGGQLGRDFEDYKRKQGINDDTKVFCMTGWYPCVKDALLDRGWHFNDDRESEYFDLKWTLRSNELNQRDLKPWQLTNHFLKNTAITTKAGLTKSLRGLHWFADASSEEIYPRAHDLSNGTSFRQFLDDFRGMEAERVLKLVRSAYGAAEAAAPGARGGRRGGAAPAPRRAAWSRAPRRRRPTTSTSSTACSRARAGRRGSTRRRRPSSSPGPSWTRSTGASTCSRSTTPSSTSTAAGRRRGTCGSRNPRRNPAAGRGIATFDDLDKMLDHCDAKTGGSGALWIVQKYMESQLLIAERKFDLRQWVLVTDWNPLTIYFYDECYARFFSAEKYSDTSESLENPFVHMVNNSIVKNSDKFHAKVVAENGVEVAAPAADAPERAKAAHRAAASGGDVFRELIQPKMIEIATRALQCAQEAVEHRKNSWELYGYDFMIDGELNPWLIEVNSSPACDYSTKVTERYVQKALVDVLKVTVDRRKWEAEGGADRGAEPPDAGGWRPAHAGAFVETPIASLTGGDICCVGAKVTAPRTAAPRSPRSPRSPKPGLETEGLEVTNGENSPRKRAARGDDSSDDADSILDGDDDATQPTPTEAVPAKPAPKPSPEKPPNAAHAKAAPPNAKAVAVTTFEFN